MIYFSAQTYLINKVYSPELKTYFPHEDTIMMRGEVDDAEDIPKPKDSNSIYEKGSKKVTHEKLKKILKYTIG